MENSRNSIQAEERTILESGQARVQMPALPLHSYVVLTWVQSHISPLKLSFHMWKMGIITPTSPGCHKANIYFFNSLLR